MALSNVARPSISEIYLPVVTLMKDIAPCRQLLAEMRNGCAMDAGFGEGGKIIFIAYIFIFQIKYMKIFDFFEELVMNNNIYTFCTAFVEFRHIKLKSS